MTQPARQLWDREAPRSTTRAAPLGPAIAFIEAIVVDPPLLEAQFDVMLSRHVLWASPRFRLCGRQASTDARLTPRWLNQRSRTDRAAARRPGAEDRDEADVQRPDDPALGGGPVSDERYLLTSRR